jgi:hypothetical protein
MNRPPASINSQRGVRVESPVGRNLPAAEAEYMSRQTSGRSMSVMLVERRRAMKPAIIQADSPSHQADFSASSRAENW